MRLSDSKNWVKPPSQGGLSMSELKKRAKKLGIDTSGLTKKQICAKIIRKTSRRKTIIRKTSRRKHSGGMFNDDDDNNNSDNTTPCKSYDEGGPICIDDETMCRYCWIQKPLPEQSDAFELYNKSILKMNLSSADSLNIYLVAVGARRSCVTEDNLDPENFLSNLPSGLRAEKFTDSYLIFRSDNKEVADLLTHLGPLMTQIANLTEPNEESSIEDINTYFSLYDKYHKLFGHILGYPFPIGLYQANIERWPSYDISAGPSLFGFRAPPKTSKQQIEKYTSYIARALLLIGRVLEVYYWANYGGPSERDQILWNKKTVLL